MSTEVLVQPEPWLRGTHAELDPIQRQVVHALELTQEDLTRWCSELTDEELNARPYGLEPVAFHLRHIARSLDRLLTYADGLELDRIQFLGLRSEMDPGATRDAVMAEVAHAIDLSIRRVRGFAPAEFGQPRGVGRDRLPATVGGLLVHCAEHTQRHTGQAITTAKLLLGLRAQ